jgi:Tol biopolymer transport system component
MAIELASPTRITWGWNNHEHPVFSPDGKHVAYYAGEFGYIQLYVSGSDGKGERPLTAARGNHTQAAWSPDKRWIYHRRQAAPDKPWEIWRVSFEDPSITECLLADKKVSFKHPSVSPDGKTLAWFSDQGTPGNFHIFTAPLDGKKGKLGKLRRLTSDKQRNDCHPTWSPDGKWLAFHAYMGQKEASVSQIYLLSADGKTVRQISDGEIFHKHPFFVGRDHLVHHSEEPDGKRYLVLRTVKDGAIVAELTSGKHNDKHPSPFVPARGPTRLVFASKKRGEEMEDHGEESTYDIFVATLAGVRVRR